MSTSQNLKSHNNNSPSSKTAGCGKSFVEHCKKVSTWKNDNKRIWFRYLILILQKITVVASILFTLSSLLGFWITSPVLPMAIIAMSILGAFNLAIFIIFECADTVTDYHKAKHWRKRCGVLLKFVVEVALTTFSLIMVGSEVAGLIKGTGTFLEVITHELIAGLQAGQWFAVIFEILVLEGLEMLVVLYEYWGDEKKLLETLFYALFCCCLCHHRKTIIST